MAKGILDRLEEGCLLFDGAMGSLLIAQGLPPGRPPEDWNHARPDRILSVHRAYLDAGADVIETNTFGATPGKLTNQGLGDRWQELNAAALDLARRAVEESEDKGTGERFVALSLGPTGMMLPPVGNATEREIRAEYERQLASCPGGVDLILIETIFDVREGLQALAAASAAALAPVAITMTFTRNQRGFFTIMGDEACEALARLEKAGADVVGANCSITSGEMLSLAPRLRERTSLPLLLQPNAGQPDLTDGKPVYLQDPDSFAADAVRLLEMGVNAVGGCCGTTPMFISKVRSRLDRGRRGTGK